MGNSSYQVFPTGTLTPAEEQCDARVRIGDVELQCGTIRGHLNVHVANLYGMREDAQIAALVQWTVERDT